MADNNNFPPYKEHVYPHKEYYIWTNHGDLYTDESGCKYFRASPVDEAGKVSNHENEIVNLYLDYTDPVAIKAMDAFVGKHTGLVVDFYYREENGKTVVKDASFPHPGSASKATLVTEKNKEEQLAYNQDQLKPLAFHLRCVTEQRASQDLLNLSSLDATKTKELLKKEGFLTRLTAPESYPTEFEALALEMGYGAKIITVKDSNGNDVNKTVLNEESVNRLHSELREYCEKEFNPTADSILRGDLLSPVTSISKEGKATEITAYACGPFGSTRGLMPANIADSLKADKKALLHFMAMRGAQRSLADSLVKNISGETLNYTYNRPEGILETARGTFLEAKFADLCAPRNKSGLVEKPFEVPADGKHPFPAFGNTAYMRKVTTEVSQEVVNSLMEGYAWKSGATVTNPETCNDGIYKEMVKEQGEPSDAKDYLSKRSAYLADATNTDYKFYEKRVKEGKFSTVAPIAYEVNLLRRSKGFSEVCEFPNNGDYKNAIAAFMEGISTLSKEFHAFGTEIESCAHFI